MLDSVIVYLNYVIFPSLMIYWFGMFIDILEIIVPALIFLVSLYTFANLRMKTDGYYFRGPKSGHQYLAHLQVQFGTPIDQA